MQARDIARWRLHSQRLAWRSFPSAVDAVEGLLAVQAENFGQSTWAVAERVEHCTVDAIEHAFDDGRLLRTHVLRPTWHFVRSDDIAWLIDLTGPRALRPLAQIQQNLEVPNDVLDRGVSTIVESLAGGVHLTREEIGDRLGDAGLSMGGQSLGLMLGTAEMTGVICSGPLKERRHTYALIAERAPNARRLEREEALAELAMRYFEGHGPATERDLAYWASLTLADVRAGVDAVRDRLGSFEYEDRTYWYGQPPPPNDGSPTPRGHLLQILDEYHHGYQDSRDALDADGVIPTGRGTSMGMALVDGQMVGDMRRTIRTNDVLFEIGPYRDLTTDEQEALFDAATRYGSFLGLHPVLDVAPVRS